jgi:hypothetical protein
MIINLDNHHQVNAAEGFINLMESGIYERMKQNKMFLDQSKSYLRSVLEPYETKRHVFKDLNWVAKFVPKKIWKINQAGLIEDLFCYVNPDIALSVLNLDAKSLEGDEMDLDTYLLPKSFYVRPTLNKSGKSYVRLHDYLFGGQTIEELVAEIRFSSLEGAKYQEVYSRFKEKSLHCSLLKEKRKINTPYGSVSLIENKPRWDLQSIYNTFGEELFIQYGKVDMAKMDALILKRLVPKSIFSAHRILKDIRLDFVVMDIESEEKAMEFYRDQQISKSLKRYA